MTNLRPPTGASTAPWLAFASLLCASMTAIAAPIEVNNASFEQPPLGGGGNTWTNNIEDPTLPAGAAQWTPAPEAPDGDKFIELIGGFASEGTQHIGTANGFFMTQSVGVAFEPNTTYTLTVGVGYRNPGQSGAEAFSVIGLTSDANTLEASTETQLENDTLLQAAHMRVESVSLNNAVQKTFTDVVMEYTTDDNPPSGNILVFLGDDNGGGRSHFDNVRLESLTALDPDGDMIPEEWEIGTDRGVARNLDPAVDDGAEDPDGDTLSNFEEFEAGTHPRLADTDGDGLNDNVDTDPLNPDIDGDTLLDGEEIATYKTDPNNPDTDGDDFEDQAEVAAGTDPLLASSKPSRGGAILIGGNFVGGTADSDGAMVTGTAGVSPQANWNNLPEGSGGPTIASDADGEASLMRVSWSTNGPAIAGDAPAAGDGNSELMHGVLFPRGEDDGGDNVATEITIKNIAYPLYDLYLYLNADEGGGTFIVGEQTYTVDEITPFDGTFVDATTTGTGNYLHLKNLEGSTLSVLGRQLGGGGAIAGFQIERLEPGDPSLLVIPERIDFGVFDGNPGSQEVSVRIINPGAAQTLNISASTITGDASDNFSVSELPATLAPNEGTDITVTFNPSDAVGIYRGFLEVTSNDVVQTTSRIPLIGQIKNANGLVAHFKMDETEGTVMNDSSGNGFHGNYVAGSGTLTLGAASLVGSGTGVALAENGQDAAYAEIPTDSGLPTLPVASYSFWVQQDAADVGTASVLFSRSSSLANPYAVFFQDATEEPNAVTWTSEAAIETLVSEPFLAPGNPVHVVYTYSDPNEDSVGDVKVYVNGVLNASEDNASGYPVNTIAPFQIGGTAGQFGFTGLVDDFQIYESVLQPEQIEAMFATPGSVAPTPAPEPILSGYWPFDDQATETADLGPNGYVGTVNGDASFVAGRTGEAGDFAIEFDGVDDSVTTAVSLLNDQGVYTIAGWVRADGDQADRTGLFGQNDLVEFGVNGLAVSAWTVAEGTLAGGDLIDGEWVHVAQVSGESERILYINGVEAVSGNADPDNRGQADFTFNIGGSGIWDADGNWFRGLIDDVAVFSVALEPSEVAALADGTDSPLTLRQPTIDVTSPGDAIVLVNGENDDDGDAGAPPGAEGVENAINDTTQKYLNFLDLGSGFIVTPSVGATTVSGMRLYTANDVPARDPASYVIEGSPVGADGPWVELAAGSLALPEDRNEAGLEISASLASQTVSFDNGSAYVAYRVTFPTLKDAGSTNSMQIAEVELLGLVGGTLGEVPGGGGGGGGDGRDSTIGEVVLGAGDTTSITFSSEAGSEYDVERSTDLIDWVRVDGATADSAMTVISVANDGPVAFYRIVKK